MKEESGQSEPEGKLILSLELVIAHFIWMLFHCATPLRRSLGSGARLPRASDTPPSCYRSHRTRTCQRTCVRFRSIDVQWTRTCVLSLTLRISLTTCHEHETVSWKFPGFQGFRSSKQPSRRDDGGWWWVVLPLVPEGARSEATWH